MQRLRELLGRLTGREVTSGDTALDRAMAAFEAGASAAESGRYKRAIDLFTQAIQSAPMTAGMYHHRGSAYADSGQHEAAIADYDVAIRLNPSYPDTYLDRGNSQHALGQLDRAIRDYSEALRLRPNFAEAYGNRAAVHAQMGDEAAADEDAQMAYAQGIDREALEALLGEARQKAD